MAFATDKLGQWSGEKEFKVEADRIKAYAAATNDPVSAHRNGEFAPPVFTVVDQRIVSASSAFGKRPSACGCSSQLQPSTAQSRMLNACATVNAIAGALPILLNSRMDVSAPMLTKANANIHERISFVASMAPAESSPREVIATTAANPRMNLGNLSHI